MLSNYFSLNILWGEIDSMYYRLECKHYSRGLGQGRGLGLLGLSLNKQSQCRRSCDSNIGRQWYHWCTSRKHHCAPGKKFKDGGAEPFNWPFNQSNELLVKVAWALDEIGV